MLRRLITRSTSGLPSRTPPDHAGRVSVVIPLYNHARFIEAAMHSVLLQGKSVGEIIVVDDGSTDGCGDIVARMARQYPCVTTWRQPNRGAHAALNSAILRATGEVIAILNSDDVFMPSRLDTLLDLLDQNETAWMAASGLGFIDDAGGVVENQWHANARAFARSTDEIGLALLNGNFLVSTSNFVIRRSAFQTVGLFAPLRYGHDLDFVLRLLLRGGQLALAETALLHYRTHDNNTIAEDHRHVRLDWAMVAGAYLLGLSTAVARRPDGFSRLRALLAILETHKLVHGATLCAAYLQAEPSTTLERSAMLADHEFQMLLSECV